jgi:hypothetical protein
VADDRNKDELWADILDDQAWDEAQRYWRAEVQHLAAEAGQADERSSWEPTTYADGVGPIERKFRSVCEGRSYKLDRGFRILQSKRDIAAWVKD